MNLDDLTLYEKLDPSRVGLAIDQFPDHLQNGVSPSTPSHVQAMVHTLRSLGILPDPLTGEATDIHSTITALRDQASELTASSPAVNNPAKRLAGQLIERLPFIHGDTGVEWIARYWQARLNLLGKNFAQAESLTELAEHGFDGLFFPQALTRRIAAVILHAPAAESAEGARRIECAREMYMQLGIAVDIITGRGDNRLTQLLTLTHYGEYVSYYVAIANGVDPSLRPATAEFKARMDSPSPSTSQA